MAFQLPSTESEWEVLFSKISTLLSDQNDNTPTTPVTPDLTNPTTIAQLIDHTLLKPNTTPSQVSQLCTEAAQHNFRTVCVRPEHVKQAKHELQESGSSKAEIGVACVIGFPVNDKPAQYSTPEKVDEAKRAIDDGATELDVVMDYVKFGDTPDPGTTESPDITTNVIAAITPPTRTPVENKYTQIYNDISTLRTAISAPKTTLKVILETSQLTRPTQIIQACVICCLAGADYVKTSTGFAPGGGGGATLEDVKLMRRTCDVCVEYISSKTTSKGTSRDGLAGDTATPTDDDDTRAGTRRVKVKASGGIKTLRDVQRLVGSGGAERIGASAGVEIIRGSYGVEGPSDGSTGGERRRHVGEEDEDKEEEKEGRRGEGGGDLTSRQLDEY